MKKYKVLILLTIVFTAFQINAYSQVFKADTSNSTRVSVFNAPADNYQFETANTEDYKYAVKINPLLILSGDIPFYFEYKLTKKLSAEVAVGPTIRNFWLEALNDEYYSATPINSNKIGRSLRAALRFYPSSTDEAIVGYYFAPEIMIRRFYSGSQFSDYSTNPTTYRDFILESNQTDFKMIFGYQDSFDSNLIIDYYIGFGLRSSEYETVNDDSGSATYLTVDKVKGVNPTFTLGLKLGFGF